MDFYVNGEKFQPEAPKGRRLALLRILDAFSDGKLVTTKKLSALFGYSHVQKWFCADKLFNEYWCQWDYKTRLWGNKKTIKQLIRKRDELEKSRALRGE